MLAFCASGAAVTAPVTGESRTFQADVTCAEPRFIPKLQRVTAALLALWSSTFAQYPDPQSEVSETLAFRLPSALVSSANTALSSRSALSPQPFANTLTTAK
jgi:hypothetical protein